MSARPVKAPYSPNRERCTAVIGLRDGTAAQCGRRCVAGRDRCWQHTRSSGDLVEVERAVLQACEDFLGDHHHRADIARRVVEILGGDA